MSYEFTTQSRDAVLAEARAILKQRIKRQRLVTTPDLVRDVVREFVALELVGREHEVFFVLYLNNQHRLIATEEAFSGTIDGCTVYPREIVRRALAHNAAAVVLAHNHPSGDATPSDADKRITARLKEALSLVDVRVLDHMIVGAEHVLSFAEECLL